MTIKEERIITERRLFLFHVSRLLHLSRPEYENHGLWKEIFDYAARLEKSVAKIPPPSL